MYLHLSCIYTNTSHMHWYMKRGHPCEPSKGRTLSSPKHHQCWPIVKDCQLRPPLFGPKGKQQDSTWGPSGGFFFFLEKGPRSWTWMHSGANLPSCGSPLSIHTMSRACPWAGTATHADATHVLNANMAIRICRTERFSLQVKMIWQILCYCYCSQLTWACSSVLAPVVKVEQQKSHNPMSTKLHL